MLIDEPAWAGFNGNSLFSALHDGLDQRERDAAAGYRIRH
jgi:hypothetical protein